MYQPAEQPTILLPISCVQSDVKLEHLDVVDAETLRKTVAEQKPVTYSLDSQIPASFFFLKTIFNSASKDILAIVKHSLQFGVFPSDFKNASVKHLLKKETLDILTLSNFRPISNLAF